MLPLFGILLLAATSAFGCVLQVNNLVVTEVGSSLIRLAWTAPAAENLSCVRGYRICSTSGAEVLSCRDTLQNDITSAFTNRLDSCTQYNVSVAAIGDNNATSNAMYVSATTAPAPVSGLSFSRNDDEFITATWNYYPRAGRSCAALFQLELCDRREITCNTYNVSFSGSEYTMEVPKKRDCNTFFLRVVALDSNNQRSDYFRFARHPAVTARPTNLMVSNASSSSFDVEWEIPESQVNCDYTIYVSIQYKPGFTSYSTNTLYDGGRTRHTQVNITSCTEFSVSVVFGTSQGDNSARTTAYTLPEEDKIFDNATVTDVTSSSVSVWWNTTLPTDQDQCVDVYNVCWGKQGSTGTSGCRNTTRDKNNLQVTGLQADTKYQLSIAAMLHSGVQYDTVTLEASTKSGSAGLVHNSLVGISAVMVCMLTLAI